MQDRFAVARALREIAALLELQRTSPFKVRAYEKGARALESLAQDLDTLVAQGRLTSVPGIGNALASVIEELHRTGRSEMLERLRQEVPPGTLELTPVLSLKKIADVHAALGISSLEELRRAAEEGRLRGVKGFGEKTEQKVLEAIRALSETPAEVLLHVATREGEALLEYVRAQPGITRAELGGALRRRSETVDRLVLVASGSGSEVHASLVRYPQVASVLEEDAAGFKAQLASGLLLEVTIVPASRFALEWHRLTGSAAHRLKLVALARIRELDLDGELRQGGRKVAVPSEEVLYERLGLPFLVPELREDAGEIEAGLQGTLPDPLVTADDVQGMVHCHTVYSDGKHTVEEMARGAEAMGMKYMTITDHSPTASYAGGLTLDRLRRQWDEIARVQETVKVRLLRGTESDILQDGALDYPDAVLDQLDVIVASIHNRYRMDERQMTKRVVAALRHPRFKIWGHAFGRYVLRRPPIPLRMEEVLEAAAESRVAVEINGNPNRLDMPPPHVREARRRGIRFVVSTDAHSIAELRNLRYGIDMARKGWLTRKDVLNTRDADEFARTVKP
jgi:DNA polymerase (family 10)